MALLSLKTQKPDQMCWAVCAAVHLSLPGHCGEQPMNPVVTTIVPFVQDTVLSIAWFPTVDESHTLPGFDHTHSPTLRINSVQPEQTSYQNIPRWRSTDGFLQENNGNQWNMEAVFQPDVSEFFPVSSDHFHVSSHRNRPGKTNEFRQEYCFHVPMISIVFLWDPITFRSFPTGFTRFRRSEWSSWVTDLLNLSFGYVILSSTSPSHKPSQW